MRSCMASGVLTRNGHCRSGDSAATVQAYGWICKPPSTSGSQSGTSAKTSKLSLATLPNAERPLFPIASRRSYSSRSTTPICAVDDCEHDDLATVRLNLITEDLAASG